MSESRKGWVPPHTHCRRCGRSIPVNKEFCSKNCAEEDSKAQQRSKRVSRIYMVIFVVLMIMLLLWSFTLGG